MSFENEVEAIEFIQEIPLQSKIVFRYNMILVPKDGSDPFMRGSIFKKGKVISKTKNSFTVKVKYSADAEKPNSGSKVDQEIRIDAEDLIQQYEHLPPRVVIGFIKPPKNNTEGGRRKTRKQKRKSKKTRSRK